MMQIVGYFVLFVMIISGALFRRSKAVLFLMLTYMWTMIALNSDSPDYSNYEYIYENAEMLKHSFEPIYMMISLVCKQFSLSFIAFRGVIAFIIVFFLYLSVKRIGIHDNYLLSLFLLYPFAGYISSLRAAVATTIIMYACTYLLDKREKTFIKYIVLVLVAAGFQYFSLYFFTSFLN